MSGYSADERSLLHLTLQEIKMKFGIPNVDYNSVLAYFRRERIMVLIFGLEKRDGMLVETVRGYACGTRGEGVLFSEGIRLYDDAKNAGLLCKGTNLEQLGSKYTVVDVGSGTYRPAMISTELSIWFVRTDGQGNIARVKEKKLNVLPDCSSEAEDIYQRLLDMESPS